MTRLLCLSLTSFGNDIIMKIVTPTEHLLISLLGFEQLDKKVSLSSYLKALSAMI